MAILTDRLRGVRMTLDSDRLRVTASNDLAEDAEGDLQVEYNGGEIEFGYSVDFLLDALASAPADRVVLEFSNAGVLLATVAGSDYRHVVMPRKL